VFSSAETEPLAALSSNDERFCASTNTDNSGMACEGVAHQQGTRVIKVDQQTHDQRTTFLGSPWERHQVGSTHLFIVSALSLSRTLQIYYHE
jgi:hypothetical protein